MELDLVHSGHRFVVEIDGKRMAAFTECTLPTLEIEVEEQKEGGLNDYVHVLPIRRKSGRVTLKRGLTNSTELLKWYQQILAGQVKPATKSLSIIMMDTSGVEMARWDFLEAIPVKWTGPQLKSDQAAVAIETLELIVHDYMA
ncbi:MAG: phage tail protein [Anaerolineales bacterium]|nr:phage tail protein [Anaerolineales bacterium]